MNVVLFGAPGSGKGTQAALISDYLSLGRVSLGDMLREEVKKDSTLGREVKAYMESGALAPDELVARVIEKNLDGENFLLDGYPRNLNQAENLESILKGRGRKVDSCIYLKVSQETAVDRLSKRRICKNCGANYHLINMPPRKEGVCDLCGGELVQRKDDSPDVIKKRWKVFSAESRQILNFYRDRGTLLEIAADGDKDSVFEKIRSRL